MEENKNKHTTFITIRFSLRVEHSGLNCLTIRQKLYKLHTQTKTAFKQSTGTGVTLLRDMCTYLGFKPSPLSSTEEQMLNK